MTNPLRTALLISSTKELPNWEIEMIRRLIVYRIITVEAFIITNKRREENSGMVLTIFKKFEDRWFRSLPDTFKNSAVTKEFGYVRMIDATDDKRIADLNLDIIYNSYQAQYDKKFVSRAKYGIWHFRFGAGDYSQAVPIGYWEVMNDIPETGSALTVLLPGASDEITVYSGSTATVPYSVKNTVNTVALKSSTFLIYRLNELLKTGPDLFFSKYKELSTDIPNKTVLNLYPPPTNYKAAILFVRNVFRYLCGKFLNIFQEKRFTILSSQQQFKITGTDFTSFKPMRLPKKHFWADPFIIEKEQKIYIFFEEFSYKKGKAHISVTELQADGSYSEPAMVLDKPYHLSYPFVFQSERCFYMIPESSSNKTVDLYKCSEFPLKWEFYENLMEGVALIDATIIFHENKWWLFATQSDHSFTSTNDQLFLYYSETLFSGNWKSHPQNPVVTIISNCRPAGKIFQLNGKLYRPAQNNASKQYGYAIKINEKEYKEKEVFEILPDKSNNLSAVHTINFVNGMIVIDGILKK